MKNLKEVLEEYYRTKTEFQQEDSLVVAGRVASKINGYEDIFNRVFPFLVSAFKGKLRNDKRTPLVFHSIYMARLLYLCDERNLDTLLTGALHDVLEDTEIAEEVLLKQDFMKGREYLVENLRILKEDTSLSREPNGENLPPRYAAHIKKMIGAPKEVINTEIMDRFPDLIDLEYIMELPEKERNFRLRAKLIKVKGFVYNITRNRKDFNQNCLNLFESRLRECEAAWNMKVDTPFISP